MNTRNLRKRRKAWAAVVYVPNHLQEHAAKHYGRKTKRLKEVVIGLGTRDLREANKRKLAVVARIQTELAALEDGDFTVQALDIAKTPLKNEGEEIALSVKADEIETKHGYEAAKRFYDIAMKQSLPISLALERWKEVATGVKPGTFKQYESDINAFIQWSNDVAVQDVSEDMAAMWWNHLKTEPTKHGTSIAPATINRKVGSLNRLWKWMKARKVHKGENYWADLLEEVPGEAKGKKAIKNLRAFTKNEAQAYLKALGEIRSKYKQAGLDIITLCWHTGIRPGDLSELTKERVLWDEDENVMWVTVLGKHDDDGGKSEANARTMPVVSPEAVAILERRIEGAGDDGKLFYDIAPVKDDYRYFRVQKVVNPVCHKALPDAPVDTYSARRSFSAACEDAGLDPVQWSRLMGHTAPTLAAAVYNRGHKGRKRLLAGIRKVHEELGELS